ncbi:unnamed protein product [Vitrella brassicaformis CCMP3155]|uniref:RING-CH-type domain-containing protein n=1 Tax=Vitrella brassicaformis (strain CCMP3155) TaxID=1169540 RepID=A0A0G4ETE9_VITBC|nr:unnamed protein product [Vitrella brassicaformis CCMP3155]|eukprot:CEM01584.1 unnamed protein product [Vitrella brassicaformis CCMP3155]
MHPGFDDACRICGDREESTETGLLVSPCSCRGTVRFVHTGCLEAFRQQRLQTTGQRPTSCEICQSEHDESWLGGTPQGRTTTRWDALCQMLCLWVVPFVALWWRVLWGSAIPKLRPLLSFSFSRWAADDVEISTYFPGPALIYLSSYLLECLVAKHPQCVSGRQLRWGVLLLLSLAFCLGADGSAWRDPEFALLFVCGFVVLLPISLKAHDHFSMRRRLLTMQRGQNVLQQAGRQLLCVLYGLLQSSHSLAAACCLSRVLAVIPAFLGCTGFIVLTFSSLLALMAVWRRRPAVERHLTTYFLPAHYQCADCRA